MIISPPVAGKRAHIAVLVIDEGEIQVWGEFRDSNQDRAKATYEELENLAKHDKILYESPQMASSKVG